MRPLRYALPGTAYEITTRTLQGKLLLTPSPVLNRIAWGILGRAQAQFSMPICAFELMGNHYHMLILPRDAKHQSEFVGFVNGNLAREVNKLRGRSGPFWGDRYHSVPIERDAPSERSRLKYLLGQGVKDDLVECVEDWPGASTAPALLRGEALAGVWYDRTAAFNARRRKGSAAAASAAEGRAEEGGAEEASAEKGGAAEGSAEEASGDAASAEEASGFEVHYTVTLTPLPYLVDRTEEERRAEAKALVDEVETTAAETRAARALAAGSDVDAPGVLGAAAIMAADPESTPRRVKRSKMPAVHATTKAARKAWKRMLKALRKAYAEASARFMSGVFAAGFPHGVFRPGGGFVRLLEAPEARLATP